MHLLDLVFGICHVDIRIGDFETLYTWLNADVRSASARHWFDEAKRVFEINPSVCVNHASSFFFLPKRR